MTETEFRLTVNGGERSVTCEPDTPLLDVLRHELGLAGPKFGCGMGLCGACFVLINGRARASCDLPVSAVGGPVTTVEGLPGGDGRLHPVQQAFVEEQAAQCGYCTSGMVLAAVGLLRERPAPAEQEVREALDGNLCRCGAHGRIIRAVQKAAVRMSGGRAVIPWPAAAEVLVSQVPAGGTPTGEGPILAPPSGSPGPLVAESGVPSGVSPLPADLAANPVLARWLDFSRDGEVTIRVGKVEYGQGIWTALAQIAAEALRGRAGPGAGSPGVHQHQPGRGCHGGQPVGRGLRLGAPAGVCAGPRGAAGCRCGQARGRPCGTGGGRRADPGR